MERQNMIKRLVLPSLLEVQVLIDNAIQIHIFNGNLHKNNCNSTFTKRQAVCKIYRIYFVSICLNSKCVEMNEMRLLKFAYKSS